MRGWVAIAGVVAGCYQPATERPCTVACTYSAVPGENGACPADLQCFSDATYGGLCKTADGTCGAGPPDADAEGSFCYGHAGGWFRPCFDAAPTGTREISGVIDTDLCNDVDASVREVGGDPRDEICLIEGGSLRIGTLRAHGVRPLAIVASTELTVYGPLDVSSSAFVTGLVGAGGNSHHCVAGTPPQTDGMGGFGGGAGGWFQGTGGAGGSNGWSDNGGKPPLMYPPPSLLRGGCGGQSGGGASSTNGGLGGGAVYLISGGRLRLDGVVNASGGGAAGNGGLSGGGGGSGGMIVIDAGELLVAPDGFLLANGGGGSSGSGAPGQSPLYMEPTMPAAGGTGPGAGGQGSAGMTTNGGEAMGVSASMLAGGGGGGAGYIFIHPAERLIDVATKSSPPPSTIPIP